MINIRSCSHTLLTKGGSTSTSRLSSIWSCNLSSLPGLALFILPLTFSWPVPWLSITLRAWRLFTLVIAVPLGVGAVLLCYLYESPTFLANKGETEEAIRVLRKIFVFNGENEIEFTVFLTQFSIIFQHF